MDLRGTSQERLQQPIEQGENTTLGVQPQAPRKPMTKLVRYGPDRSSDVRVARQYRAVQQGPPVHYDSEKGATPREPPAEPAHTTCTSPDLKPLEAASQSAGLEPKDLPPKTASALKDQRARDSSVMGEPEPKRPRRRIPRVRVNREKRSESNHNELKITVSAGKKKRKKKKKKEKHEDSPSLIKSAAFEDMLICYPERTQRIDYPQEHLPENITVPVYVPRRLQFMVVLFRVVGIVLLLAAALLNVYITAYVAVPYLRLLSQYPINYFWWWIYDLVPILIWWWDEPLMYIYTLCLFIFWSFCFLLMHLAYRFLSNWEADNALMSGRQFNELTYDSRNSWPEDRNDQRSITHRRSQLCLNEIEVARYVATVRNPEVGEWARAKFDAFPWNLFYERGLKEWPKTGVYNVCLPWFSHLCLRLGSCTTEESEHVAHLEVLNLGNFNVPADIAPALKEDTVSVALAWRRSMQRRRAEFNRYF